MEQLKKLAELREPDERSRYRNLTIEDLHSISESLTLGPAVPEHVRNQFEIARHAFIYSWFYYPFLPAAEMYSILAVELALRLKLKEVQPGLFSKKREPALKELLQMAIKARLLTDMGFNVQIPANEIVMMDPNNPQSKPAPADQRYCYRILEVLPALRNDLAHGDFALYPGVSHSMARGVELINQLFQSVE